MTRKLAVTAGVLVVAVVADLIIGADIPGYDALLGLLGCIVIIIASKWLGKKVIQRPAGYYQRETGVPAAPDPVADAATRGSATTGSTPPGEARDG